MNTPPSIPATSSNSPAAGPSETIGTSETSGTSDNTLLRAHAVARDAADPLADCRSRFSIPEDVIYLDGNSLGPLPNGVAERVARAVTEEWGTGLIRSWNNAGWVDLPAGAGAKIARLIGAEAGNVMVTDSTSVNLFKVVSAALALRPDRQVILTETRNFPTDNYIAEGVIKQCGDRHRLVHLDDAADLTDALDENVAVLMLTHVSYRTGAMHDMKALTKAAHDVGALVIWDLAHSAGALPVDLAGCDADFAVGCGYKYLNGGPGAPSFVYVAPQHLGGFRQPLTGWFAHKDPFAFAPHYEPATDITQFLCGTSPVLSLVALDAALDVWADVDMDALRSKSSALCDYFIQLVESRCDGHGLTLITPRDAAVRGSQVSFTHETGGYAMISALIADGVIGDFRAPDILRFGFTPLYTRFVDVWDAVDRLAIILAERRWDTPAFHARKTVT